MATQIRKEQNWAGQELTVDDFGGDDKAWREHRANAGPRQLSQREKIVMFGLVDKQMRNDYNTLKTMVGMDQPRPRKARRSLRKAYVRGGGSLTSPGTTSPGASAVGRTSGKTQNNNNENFSIMVKALGGGQKKERIE